MGYRSVGKLADFGRPELMREAQRRTVKRVGDLLHERVTELTPVAKPPPGAEAEWLAARKRPPGALKESWRVTPVMLDRGPLITASLAVAVGELVSVEVFTRDPIAPYVEWPTLPHLILPRRPGGWLRFWDKYGNKIYARIVHHTGTKGSYMMTTALGELDVLWERVGAEEMERWAREARMAA